MRIVSPEQKAKTSAALKAFYQKNPEARARVAKDSKVRATADRERMAEIGRRGGQEKQRRHPGVGGRPPPKSILDVSSRTVTKILKRLGIGCSNCGWDKATCDLHHIRGRKIQDPDNHSNLTCLCPNCHRLAHVGLLKQEDLVTFQEQIGDRWLKYYYGE